jgi:hypothetical protein
MMLAQLRVMKQVLSLQQFLTLHCQSLLKSSLSQVALKLSYNTQLGCQQRMEVGLSLVTIYGETAATMETSREFMG